MFGIFAYWVARRLSRKRALKLADHLGALAYYMFRKYRNVCLDNLTIAYGNDLSKKEKLKLTLKSQTNLIRTIMDFLKFEEYSKEEFLSLAPIVIGREHLENAFEKSKGGVIGLAGHLGSWEYSGAWMVASGWNLSAVGKEQRDPGITKIMLDQRAAAGIKHIPRAKSGNLELVRALKTKNTMLGLISDQNGGHDGVFVDFFGTQASSAKGPAFLAMKYDVPVVPIFAIWDGDLYRIEILPEVEVTKTGDEEKDIAENTQRFQKVIEGMVRKYPEQWLWAHRRWKTRPKG
ncbi:MAG: lysophospholipid acyltransferase family protein [bacterium]|nr:lysophospholipid acyltransferase family protein [bacterium]